jgi:hypothetical protein
MPRLGGGAYKQSYLVAGGSTSQTQILERPRTPPTSSGIPRRHPELGLPTMMRSESPPALVTPRLGESMRWNLEVGRFFPIIRT